LDYAIDSFDSKNEFGIDFIVNIFPKRIFNFNPIFFIHLKGDCVN